MEFRDRDHDFLAEFPVVETDVGKLPSKKEKKMRNRNRKPSQKDINACIRDETQMRNEYAQSHTGALQKHAPSVSFYWSSKERHSFEDKFTKPKNRSQEIYTSLLRNKNKKVVVANGPAGTGKTLFATEFGIKYFLSESFEKLIFTRPSVAVDEDLGYLPGTLEEKMAPWVRPIYDILYQFMTVKEVQGLLEDKTIEIAPLGFMRGRTFKNAWIVADEMQNSTMSQMKMLLTRLGENSRLIITGDLDQHDKQDQMNGLEDFLRRFRGKRSSSISSFEFEKDDIQREEVVKEVLDIYGGDTIPDYTDSSSDVSPETTSIDGESA
jgi:phosphate starvation-inducible PhoH-like protein